MAELIKRGRVKDIYKIDPTTQVIVSTDRVAFDDVVLETKVPEKGAIVNQIVYFWMDYLKDIVSNNLITIDNKEMPKKFWKKEFENRCMMVKKVDVLPISVVVRGYLTGSAWNEYNISGKVCGIYLPRGFDKNERLSQALYTPKMRLKNNHSISITFKDTINMLGKETAYEIKDVSLQLYSKAIQHAQEIGIIIADTKFKFGINSNGELVLLDGLTPDCSRIWSIFDYAFNKDDCLNKRWIAKHIDSNTIPEETIPIASNKYYEVMRMITGKTVIN